MLRASETVIEVLFDLLDIFVVEANIQRSLYMIPVVKGFEIFSLDEALTYPTNYLIHGGILVHADDMHLAMEVRCTLTLVFRATLQC